MAVSASFFFFFFSDRASSLCQRLLFFPDVPSCLCWVFQCRMSCLFGRDFRSDVKGCRKEKKKNCHIDAAAFTFFFLCFVLYFFPPDFPTVRGPKNQHQLCPAVLTPALNQPAADPSVRSYYSSKYYHTKPVFFFLLPLLNPPRLDRYGLNKY